MVLEESKAGNIGCAKVDGQSLSCEYALEDIRGRVEVLGKMGPGNYYSLKANLDENERRTKIVSVKHERNTYFPANTFGKSAEHSDPIINWYTKFLSAMGEPSLWHASKVSDLHAL